jgi:hypothetical protein
VESDAHIGTRLLRRTFGPQKLGQCFAFHRSPLALRASKWSSTSSSQIDTPPNVRISSMAVTGSCTDANIQT